PWSISGWQGGSGSAARERVVEPRPRKAPLAFDRGRRQLHHFGDLRRRQAAEELELDDAALARVDVGKSVESLVPRNQIHRWRFADVRLAERDASGVSTALVGGAAARVVDENPPHPHGGKADELRAAHPVHAPLIDQPYIRL